MQLGEDTTLHKQRVCNDFNSEKTTAAIYRLTACTTETISRLITTNYHGFSLRLHMHRTVLVAPFWLHQNGRCSAQGVQPFFQYTRF